MATFLDVVNRVLRINNIISGEDDNLTDFTDTQHASDTTLCQIAVQDELSEVVSDRDIPYEKANASITLLTSTRTYTLASDFVRFYGQANFYDSTANVRIFEFNGGEKLLQLQDYNYKTNEGAPIAWYWDNTTTKSVAFYSVPNSTYNNRSISYDYEKSVMVTLYTDTIPFHNNEEFYSFSQMCARRMFFMLTNDDLGLLTSDPTYNNAKARLYQFIRPSNAGRSYGYSYR